MARHAADSGKVFAAILLLVAAHVRGPVVPVVEDRQHTFDAVRGGFQRRFRKELAVQPLAGLVNRPAEIPGRSSRGPSTARGDGFFALCVPGCIRPKF